MKSLKDTALWVIHMEDHQAKAVESLPFDAIGVGWVELGDLTQYSTRASLKRAMNEQYGPLTPRKLGRWTGHAFNFTHSLEPESLFVYPVMGDSEIRIGRITGNYRFEKDNRTLVEADVGSIREVKWLSTLVRTDFSAKAQASFNARHTIHDASPHVHEVLAHLADLAL